MSMKKKNILFVLPWLPFPMESGGHQAIFNGISAVTDDFNVFITYPTDDPEADKINRAKLSKDLNNKISMFPVVTGKRKKSFSQRVAKKLRKLLMPFEDKQLMHKNPYSFWTDQMLSCPKALCDMVKKIIAEHDIEIVQAEMLKTIGIIHHLPDTVKKTFVHHELGFVRTEQELQNVKDDIFDGEGSHKNAKILEIGLLNKYDTIITLSETDRNKLIANGVTSHIETSFAIVKPFNNPGGTTEPEGFKLTFCGAGIHKPNYIGLKWFLDNCWQQLLEHDSRYSLSIIGNWNEWFVNTWTKQYPNIHFTGYVDDLAETLRGTIMIVPINVGSGIRMKILEAMNIGVPFVSTTIGAEGIPVEDGKDCFIADSPEDFVASIINMRKENLFASFVENSRRKFKDLYSLDALKANRLSIYKK